MEEIRDYVLLIGGFLIFQALMEGLLPTHISRKYIRLVLGAVFLLVMIQPITNLFHWQIDWEREENFLQGVSYESQVQQMTEEEYERILQEAGLPEEWAEKWQIRKITVTCSGQGTPEKIQVQVTSKQQKTKIEPVRIQLGGVGYDQTQSEEEEQLSQSLAEYWGTDPSVIRVKIEKE